MQENEDVEVKSLIGSIIRFILQSINMRRIQDIITRNIQKKYQIGMDELEVKLNMNFVQDSEKIAFLTEYAFENVKGMTDELAEKLRKELSDGVMNLESVTQISKRIQNIMDVSKERAVMIARTESIRAENMGKLDGAAQSGLNLKKYWDATRDQKQCKYCRAMADKYDEAHAIPLDRKFTLDMDGKHFEVQAAPLHPNCRCSVFFRNDG